MAASEKKTVQDEQLARIIDSGSAGVETAMRAFEHAEQIYYGAVLATSPREIVTVSANTNPRPSTAEPR
jgi:hypothetical protein